MSNYSWRWIFYINVPIGIVTLVLSHRWLPKWDTDERFTSSFDTLGFCLLSPGLAALVYSLSEVGTTGGFTSPSVVISFVLGVVLMTGFTLHALHIKNPLLELHLFKDRTYAIANICIFVLGATLFGSMFLLPLYYQIARGQEAWVAGLLMAPQGIGAACIMRWAGSFTDRHGPRRIVPFGILLMAAATIPFAFVTTSTSEVLLAVTLFVRGLGLGLTMMPVTAAAYFNLNHAEIPKATHDHEHRAPGRRLGGHGPVRRRAGAPDRGRAGPGGRQGRGQHRRDLVRRQAAAAGRRSGGRCVRPHLLVVRGRDPHRLHPDAVPAQPRGRTRVRRTPERRRAARRAGGDAEAGPRVAGAMLD